MVGVAMLALGIDVHVNVNVGDDVTFDELRQQNDALYIALGAHTDKKTGIEGGDAEGVISKPPPQATLADVDAHLALLGAQISADTRRHRALKELRDLALAAGATDDSPLLATLSTADLLMTEVVS